ncbi:MAG: LuxR C-terminal-related transcriptional regulator, partial [Muribaculaceae bacterium]|nr:LuxR C-terminal-related transcriptional regulator [Muribaculaceae bacterium]
MSRIGISGLSSLEKIGIKSILREIPEPVFAESSVTVYDSFDGLYREADKTDVFIVDISQFVRNLEFFMPRRSRTIVVDMKCSRTDFREKGEGINSKGINCLYADSSEEEVREIMRSILAVPSSSTESSGDLTFREKEVLKELASGKTNKEIADILSISVNTVITHRKN